MAVPLKMLVAFIIANIFSVVNSLPAVRDLNSSKNLSVPTAMVGENIIINLLKKRREIIRGHGESFKELVGDFISSTTETASYHTTKTTEQKDKLVDEHNEDLSVVALAILNVQNVTEVSKISKMLPSKQEAKKAVITVAAVQTPVEADLTHVVSHETPETSTLPTGARFTDADSDSLTTNIISRRVSDSDLFDIFFSECGILIGVCIVFLLGVGVVRSTYGICVRKHEKNQEAVEKKNKQIITSNQ